MVKQTKHGADAIKRKDASVVKHGSEPVHPNEHWQMMVGNSVFQRGYGDDPGGAFLPKPGKDRPVPHVKVNECDH